MQEHERAAGAWQAEWDGIAGALAAAGGGASHMAEVLDGLVVHPERMRANLEATRGLIMSERLVFALASAWAAKTRTRSCARPAHGPASAAPPCATSSQPTSGCR